MSIKTFIIEPVFGKPIPAGKFPNCEWNDKEITEWINPATGERKQWPHLFGPGAMWRAIWYPKNFEWDNEEEPHLIVVCPSGSDWDIDSRASNCTMKGDRTHRCWIRHGQPPEITVDKKGKTCQAGAGSIMAGNYHGFLRSGMFT